MEYRNKTKVGVESGSKISPSGPGMKTVGKQQLGQEEETFRSPRIGRELTGKLATTEIVEKWSTM